MRLTEFEQQEVRRYLDANKPLPEKYRFLLFEDKREVELVWNGKTNQICNLVLPFQTIEHVDEPREEQPDDQPGLFDARGRQESGWTNKLIWGDNKLILSSLKNGPLRQEIEAQGGLKLIYIDPPFDADADFSMNIEVGDDTLTKSPNILEEIAYRDTWGNGADSFISMIYERLVLLRDLLAEDGSIFVHMGPKLSPHTRLVLEELFETKNLLGDITWQRTDPHNDAVKKIGVTTDRLLWFAKSASYFYDSDIERTDLSAAGEAEYSLIELPDGQIVNYKGNESRDGQRFKLENATWKGSRNRFSWRGVSPSAKREWIHDFDGMETALERGELYLRDPAAGSTRCLKRYLREVKGIPLQDIWDEVGRMKGGSEYPTQKPERFIERVINIASKRGDLVADFFVGSGTTAAVAEKLGRKWIVADLGKFSIHTTRKRMIGVQRDLKKQDKPYRAFEILNLGRYQRQMYVVSETDSRDARELQLAEVQAAKDKELLNLILRAYRAQTASGYRTFQGVKAGRLVAVGPVNMPVTRLFIEELVLECREKKITRVDVLAFEFEMGLFPQVLDEAAAKGIDIQPKHIPAEVFDKRAVARGQVAFYDVAYVEAVPLFQDKHKLSIELSDFSVFYSQNANDQVIREIKDGSSKVIVDGGQVVKVSKDRHGTVTRHVLTTKWTDWVDYWSVDLDYENKKELVHTQDAETGEWKRVWTGDFTFENEWQSFRTKQNRSLELKTPYFDLSSKPGRRKVAVKVVDIFGNDTMKLMEVTV